jgi:hypothetical protein
VRSSSPSLPLPCSVSLSKRKDHKLDGSKSVGIIELGSYETLLQYNCVMVVAPYVTRAVRRRARLLLPSARAPEPTDPHPTNPSLLLPPLPSPRLSLPWSFAGLHLPVPAGLCFFLHGLRFPLYEVEVELDSGQLSS